jgi:hypothetical protein
MVRDAMSVILWTVGVLVSLMAVVIAALPMRRRDPNIQKPTVGPSIQKSTVGPSIQKPTVGQSIQKPTLGSISGNWLTEYNAKHRQDRS